MREDKKEIEIRKDQQRGVPNKTGDYYCYANSKTNPGSNVTNLGEEYEKLYADLIRKREDALRGGGNQEEKERVQEVLEKIKRADVPELTQNVSREALKSTSTELELLKDLLENPEKRDALLKQYVGNGNKPEFSDLNESTGGYNRYAFLGNPQVAQTVSGKIAENREQKKEEKPTRETSCAPKCSIL